MNDSSHFNLDDLSTGFIAKYNSSNVMDPIQFNTLHIAMEGIDETRRMHPGINRVILDKGDSSYEYDADKLIDMLKHMCPTTAFIVHHHIGDGIGHCNCSACNWLVDPYDRYCRRCGAKFEPKEDTWRK